MSVTGQQVFDLAMSLMDEVLDNGTISASDTVSYSAKSPRILTLLQVELLPPAATLTVITDLTQTLTVTDREGLLVLPYGLAAHLILTEDPSTATFFQQRYEELRRKKLAVSTPITDVYDVTAGMI